MKFSSQRVQRISVCIFLIFLRFLIDFLITQHFELGLKESNYTGDLKVILGLRIGPRIFQSAPRKEFNHCNVVLGWRRFTAGAIPASRR